MITVHMICGFLGVGKTTFATELAQRENAVLFSLDQLYLKLFANGPTYELNVEAMDRLRDVVADLWTATVRSGSSVVLDLGFWDRASRHRTARLAESLNAAVKLYWVQCSDDVALKRCLKRNGRPGAFLISPEGFQQMRSRFEAPGEDEAPEGIRTDG